MKASLKKETAMVRAVNALLGKTAATLILKLVSKLRPSTAGRTLASSGHTGRRDAAPRCQRLMLVKGGVRHG